MGARQRPGGSHCRTAPPRTRSSAEHPGTAALTLIMLRVMHRHHRVLRDAAAEAGRRCSDVRYTAAAARPLGGSARERAELTPRMPHSAWSHTDTDRRVVIVMRSGWQRRGTRGSRRARAAVPSSGAHRHAEPRTFGLLPGHTPRPAALGHCRQPTHPCGDPRLRRKKCQRPQVIRRSAAAQPAELTRCSTAPTHAALRPVGSGRPPPQHPHPLDQRSAAGPRPPTWARRPARYRSAAGGPSSQLSDPSVLMAAPSGQAAS